MSYLKPFHLTEFAEHTLEVHLDTPQLKAWYLRPANGSRMQSVFILSTVEGLVIMGDLCPGDNRGAISCYGYGVDWFAGRLSERYLCSKFMRTEWVPEVGLADLRGRLVNAKDDGRLSEEAVSEAISDAERALHYGELTYERAREIFDEANLCDFEDLGQDYNHRDAGLLIAIQRRFAELYHSLRAVEELSPLSLPDTPRE